MVFKGNSGKPAEIAPFARYAVFGQTASEIEDENSDFFYCVVERESEFFGGGKRLSRRRSVISHTGQKPLSFGSNTKNNNIAFQLG